MTEISDLPNELLFNIVSHLDTGNEPDVATLSRVCQTSHRFLDIARPILYDSIVIKESRCLFSLHLLRRTLMLRPSLSEKTTKLTLSYNNGVSDEWDDDLSQDADLNELLRSIGFVSDLEGKDCYIALATEVLKLLPNLQYLFITAMCGLPDTLFKYLHRLRNFDYEFLYKLKTFHLHNKYRAGTRNIRPYRQFMDYPAFEKLSIQTDVPDVPGQYPTINTVTHTAVELFWCLIPSRTMVALLNACRRLTIFKFIAPKGSHYVSSWNTYSAPMFLPSDIIASLLQIHGESLQTLHLDFRYYYNLYDPEGLQLLRMGEFDDWSIFMYTSFRNFTHLSHMTIEFEKLAKACHLPESLESLELRHFQDLDRAFLGDLVRLRETWCPAIKSVTINGWQNDKGMAAVRQHAESLDLRLSASVDGRVLEILGIGYRLVIQNLAEDKHIP